MKVTIDESHSVLEIITVKVSFGSNLRSSVIDILTSIKPSSCSLGTKDLSSSSSMKSSLDVAGEKINVVSYILYIYFQNF